jgi:hypothetical protein
VPHASERRRAYSSDLSREVEPSPKVKLRVRSISHVSLAALVELSFFCQPSVICLSRSPIQASSCPKVTMALRKLPA